MAEVTVRVKLDKTFKVTCDATNADEAIENIIDYSRLDDSFIEECELNMEVVVEDSIFDEEVEVDDDVFEDKGEEEETEET